MGPIRNMGPISCMRKLCIYIYRSNRKIHGHTCSHQSNLSFNLVNETLRFVNVPNIYNLHKSPRSLYIFVDTFYNTILEDLIQLKMETY